MVSAIEGLPLIPILAHSYDGPEETAQKLCQSLMGLAQLLAHSQKLRIVHGCFKENLYDYCLSPVKRCRACILIHMTQR